MRRSIHPPERVLRQRPLERIPERIAMRLQRIQHTNAGKTPHVVGTECHYGISARNDLIIAKQLDLSVKTVESHRGEIMKRLKMHDVVSLVRYAMRVGLVTAAPGSRNN